MDSAFVKKRQQFNNEICKGGAPGDEGALYANPLVLECQLDSSISAQKKYLI